MSKEPYDASNPKHVKNAKQKRAHLNQRFRNGIIKIINDDDCRHVLNEFLQMTGPFRDTYVTDPRDDARNSGLRTAGLWWITNGLLHDKDFISKIQADDGSPITESQDDGHDDNDNDSGPDNGGG